MTIKVSNFIKDPPLWVLNGISFISGIVTIVTAGFGIISIINKTFTIKTWYICFSILLLFLVILLLTRMRKYNKLLSDRMRVTAYCYHKFIKELRDVYFDVMNTHKNPNLKFDIKSLSAIYKDKLTFMLDDLCSIMSAYTSQEVSACIKVITFSGKKENVNISTTKMQTFCRDSNSKINRGSYENNATPIKLSDNTDFKDIVDPVNGNRKGYFYQGDLQEYSEELEKQGKAYQNSNPCWKNDYIGTIVVPIQLDFRLLYSQKRDSSKHVIGFLCLDSKSKNAFTKRQENYNIAIAKSFADAMYIILGQYRHYLKKYKRTSWQNENVMIFYNSY